MTPKHTNPNTPMSDKTFSRTMATCLLSIVLCMVALVSTTWAWFEDSTTATSTLTAGTFNGTGTVTYTPLTAAQTLSTQTNSVPAAESPVTFNLSPAEDGSLTFTAPGNAKDNVYTITLKASDTTNAKGFFIINLRNNSAQTTEKYRHTQAITPDNREVIITVIMTEGESVRIVPCWGLPSKEHVLEANEKLISTSAEKAALAAAKAAAAAAAETNAAGVSRNSAETNAAGIPGTPAETNAAS